MAPRRSHGGGPLIFRRPAVWRFAGARCRPVKTTRSRADARPTPFKGLGSRAIAFSGELAGTPRAIPRLKTLNFVPKGTLARNPQWNSNMTLSYSTWKLAAPGLRMAVALFVVSCLSGRVHASGPVSGSSIRLTQPDLAGARKTQELIAGAQDGDPHLQYILGLCYQTGRGVSKDPAEALKWFAKAADQGLDDAEYTLGCCYNGEDGYAKNPAEAVKWWGLAAKQGHAGAQYCLALSYFAGEGTAKSHAEAAKWWRKAAEQNYADAQYYLGVCYSLGLGVPKAQEQAMFWLRKALAGGNMDAMALLANLK